MEDVERGSYLLMSLVLGILVVPIIVYGQKEESDIHAVNVVNGINVTLKFLATVTIMFAIISIHKNRHGWVNGKASSLIIKTKLGCLWVFGVAKIVFNVIQETFYIKCRSMIPWELTTSLAIECFANVLFVILQLIFFLYMGRYTFANKPRIKYVALVIAMTNFMEFLILMTLSVNGNKDLIFDGNNTAAVDCIGYSQNVVDNFIKVLKAFKPPVALQFTALAITLAFSMIHVPIAETLGSTLTSHYIRFSWRTPERLAKIVVIVSLMNVPPLVYFPFKFANPVSNIQSHVWLYTLLAVKTTVLICILALNYLIFKKLKLCVKNVKLDVDEFALLASTIALVAYMTIETFDKPEVKGELTALHVINLLTVVYQIIIILFGRRMDLVGNEISNIHLIQQFIVILACNNMAEWFNCFLYGLWNMEHILRHNVFKYISFMLYPLLAYWRFQSAMELMELYRHLSVVYI